MGLRTDLAEIIPEDLISDLPDGYEVLGKIVIISIPQKFTPYYKEIIQILRMKRPSLKTILNKTSSIQGKERVAKYQFIFGSQTITEIKEFGFRYQLNIQDVFFSTKMASERKRIYDLIQPEEDILVTFAGVGPYAIPAAARGATVIAIEISNPACKWMSQNAHLNHISSNLHVIQGDAMQAVTYLNKKFSRIIIPTPYGLLKRPEIFLSKLMKEGTAHWITFCNKTQVSEITSELLEKGYQINRIHKCGNVAPSVFRWILDIYKL